MRWLDTPADSLRGQLKLLIIDKLAIGTLLGVAFIAYDQWKDSEIRAYTESRTVAELAFQRASFVSTLTPIVLDSTQNPILRVQTLRSLLETGSLSSSAAIPLAERILTDQYRAYAARGQYPNPRILSSLARSDSLRTTLLIDLLSPRLSGALPTLIELQASSTASEGWCLPQGLVVATSRPTWCDIADSTVQGFWAKAFVEAINKTSRDSLALVLGDELIRDHLGRLVFIARRTPAAILGTWLDSRSSALRALAAIGLLETRDSARAEKARTRYSELMNSDRTALAVQAAAAIVADGAQRFVQRPDIARLALSALVRHRDDGVPPVDLVGSVSPPQERNAQLAGFVKESLLYEEAAGGVTPHLELLLGQLSLRLRSSDQRFTSGRDEVDRWAVRATLNFVAYTHYPGSMGVRARLAELFSLDSAILARDSLDGHIAQWRFLSTQPIDSL